MSIQLERLIKQYDDHPVVNNVSLEVGDGEFFVLLGPSGSGKSTVLRLIAGLTDIDGGHVLLHGRDVTRLPPRRRGIGFVFQSYALFRHMSVGENIEFPLRVRKVPRAERRRRRDELLELVGLAGLGRRFPQQLSGGQQQRVGLARALAHSPEVLLLDEPFGALDARIRTELRRTVRAIQRELKISTIFVTHDQEEAFELADRIGVMNFGRLLESGPPWELYLRPQTEFVATFLGTANLMVGATAPDGVRLGPLHFPMSTGMPPVAGTRRVQVLFRPEDVAVKTSSEALGWPLLGEAVVEDRGFLGSFERLRLRMPKLQGVRPIAPSAPFGGDFVLIDATRSQHQARRFPLRQGDKAWVGVRRVHALTHPGLSFLFPTDGSPESRAALEMGSQLARLAQARVTLLAFATDDTRADAQLQQAREWIGSLLPSVESRPSPDPLVEAVAQESGRRHYDLLVHALPGRDRVELAERLLQAGDHNLLLVPSPLPQSSGRTPVPPKPGAAPRPAGAPLVPSRALISIAVGEPAKEDVLFAGRLIRHLGTEATIVTVLSEEASDLERRQAERFLAACLRTLSLMDVTSKSVIRRGEVRDQIRAQLGEGDHDLLIFGAPLPDWRGRIALDGLIKDLIEDAAERPVLIVRPHTEDPWRT
ncbi:MAG TPA: ATP-binding cassette domain-containing protein [Candidatus Cryosericum sp.]|nr:ATP-binding cassette domain-containing protein [Candidatus Cryosericum sp.]